MNFSYQFNIREWIELELTIKQLEKVSFIENETKIKPKERYTVNIFQFGQKVF